MNGANLFKDVRILFARCQNVTVANIPLASNYTNIYKEGLQKGNEKVADVPVANSGEEAAAEAVANVKV